MTQAATKGRRRADVEKDDRRKLSVFTDPETIRRLGIEKYESGMTIEEIVNRRLRISYETHPDPLRSSPEPAAAS